MRKHFVLLLLFPLTLTLAHADAADKAGKYTVLSMGTKSCGEVVKNFNEQGTPMQNNSIWVAGYLTAFNKHVSPTSNIAAGTDPEAWNLWIFNYCGKNPLDDLSDATSALVLELLRRSPNR